jgi:hypothetical protein
LTLDECFLAVAIGAAIIPKTGSASSAPEQENKGKSMATKRDKQAADYRAETQSGIRTERVTLECVHRFGKSPRDWDWWRLMELRPGESVRVVEETHFDDLAQVAMERDAAIRERDALRASAITQALTADRFASAVQEADKLQARVAELEEQLESVACRAATAETALEAAAKLAPRANDDGGSNHAAQAASGGGEGEPVAWEYDIATPHGTGRGVSNLDPRKHSEIWQLATGVPATDARPLYRSPPQPRGWLTSDERDWINYCQNNYPIPYGALACFDVLLARSSPPEVVLPDVLYRKLSVEERAEVVAWFANASPEKNPT